MIALAADAPAADVASFVAGEQDEYPSSLSETFLIGTPEEVRQRMQQYTDLGITHFMLWFMDAPNQSGMELFAREFMIED
jgi:alkanesulfonate monooxygenase SsuD/methylene tetrahydromethanopterin reductase-like flavin-dependent oxidoreductase (luciferase family)